MRKKLLTGLILTIAGVAAGCSRQSQDSSSAPPVGFASGSNSAQATAAVPPSAVPPAGANPEPVAPPDPSADPPAQPNTAAAAPPDAPAPEAVGADLGIPAGTRIRVRLGRSLDTKHSRAGERFVAYLDDPVVSGDRVVLPKGTEFQGHVTEAKRSGRLRGRAYLGLRLDSFRLQGARYEIRTNADVARSRNHKRRNVALIGGGAGGGAAIGAIAGGGAGALIGAGAGAVAGTTGALITGRKDVRLPVESILGFSLEGGVFVAS